VAACDTGYRRVLRFKYYLNFMAAMISWTGEAQDSDLGAVFKKIYITRFTENLSTLVSGGISAIKRSILRRSGGKQ